MTLRDLAESEADSGFDDNAGHLRAVAGLLERLANLDSDSETIAPLIAQARELTKG